MLYALSIITNVDLLSPTWWLELRRGYHSHRTIGTLFYAPETPLGYIDYEFADKGGGIAPHACWKIVIVLIHDLASKRSLV